MEETLIKRVMPNSLEAEQAVIGSMSMDQDAIVIAMEILLQEDFYHKQYGILFDAMIELYSSGQPVDLVTLQNKLTGSLQSGIRWRIGACGSDIRECQILL